MTILVLCAHPDDEVFGAGATLAKYAKEGRKIVSVIFSSGESANPWLKKEVITEMRKKESRKADEILGISQTIFLDLPDTKVEDSFVKRKLEKKIVKLIKFLKPSKIFTHSIDDPHPDHRAVYNIAMRIADKIKFRGDIFSFDIWNPVKMKHRDMPKMYVDVSGTFKLKISALKVMKSQKITMLNLLPTVYFKAIKTGLLHRCRFAERFVKVR